LNQQKYIIDLVRKVKMKDMLAMQTLYEKYAQDMLTTSFRITGDLQLSEDILQEAFLRSFQKINQLNVAAKYPSWLKRIIVNKSLSAIKNRIRFQEIRSEYLEDEEEYGWYQKISFQNIQDAILELPDGCQQVFTLYLLEQYKHKEIAEMMKISESTSKSQYRYALKLLREKLKP